MVDFGYQTRPSITFDYNRWYLLVEPKIFIVENASMQAIAIKFATKIVHYFESLQVDHFFALNVE